jgi:hypothetical protein
MECFVDSKRACQISEHNQAYHAIERNQQFQQILNKCKKITFQESGIESAIDIASGKIDNILDSFSNEIILGVINQNGLNDWIITATSDTSIQVGVIRKKYPKSRQIAMIITECSEFGIVYYWAEMRKYIMLPFIRHTLRSMNEEMFEEFDEIISEKKENIVLNDFKSVFKLFSFGVIIALFVEIYEIYFHLVYF